MSFKQHKLYEKRFLLAMVGVGVTGLVVGLIIGFCSDSSANDEAVNAQHADKFQDQEFVNNILQNIEAENIRGFLQILSKEPHIAASDRDRWLIEWIKRKWLEFGLDDVTLSTYDFLVSYPRKEDPNKIHLLDAENNKVWTSRHREEVPPEEENENYIDAFHAYAPSGDITGELVYVNYARVEDVEELNQLGVSLQGKIAIARYGKIFRGSKLLNCERAGAIGLILYSDPAEVARQGIEPENLYPNTFFLPESGIQRGSVCEGDGDPLSPGWSSLPGAYRLKANESNAVGDVCFDGMPGIPSQPIGYGDARRLLELMGGSGVPDSWAGGLPSLTYHLGPGFNQEHKDWRVRLVVNNYMEDKESSNVIGVIRGEVEPDRYVIIGNHRDSWGYGAADPSSGTAALMEIARTLGAMVKGGWRPRRSIVFASWAVEEYGLEGSYEYVFDNINKITNRAVGNLNMDTCVAGPILVPKASPVMKDLFIEAIKVVKDPANNDRTLYDFFVEYNEEENPPVPKVEDRIKILGAGSDHATFAFIAGVPAVYFRFEPDTHIYKGLTGYPVYHTGFDTFWLMDNIQDNGFHISRSCAQLTTHMALNLGESHHLPLNIMQIFPELEKGIRKMEANNLTLLLREHGAGPAYDLMISKMEVFKAAALKWSENRESLIRSGQPLSDIQLRIMNDQIMLLERVFLLPEGLPGRPDVRHALFSPAKFDAYGGSALPGIGDLLYDVDTLSPEEQTVRYESVKQHLSVLMTIFHQAANWLGQPAAL